MELQTPGGFNGYPAEGGNLGADQFQCMSCMNTHRHGMSPKIYRGLGLLWRKSKHENADLF